MKNWRTTEEDPSNFQGTTMAKADSEHIPYHKSNNNLLWKSIHAIERILQDTRQVRLKLNQETGDSLKN